MARPYLWLVIVALLTVSCSPAEGDPSALPPEETVSREVLGSEGAVLETPGGDLRLEIPPGAIDGTATISISSHTPTTEQAAALAGRAFQILPAGLRFATPVTLTLRATRGVLPDAPVYVSRLNPAGGWSPVEGTTPHSDLRPGDTVAATIEHLSVFGLAEELAAPAPTGHTLTVLVVDETQQPMEGAVVQVGDTSRPTDQTGLAIFTGLEGSVSIVVSKEGYREATESMQIETDTQTTITLAAHGAPDDRGMVETVFVSFDGDDSDSGESAHEPVQTLARAAHLVASGGRILLRGSASEAESYIVTAPIYIKGERPFAISGGYDREFETRPTGSKSLLDGADGGRIMTVEGLAEADEVSLERLVFANGVFTGDDGGGGIQVLDSHLEISHCEFNANRGSAINSRNSHLEISQSTFANNEHSSRGGAISAKGGVLVIRGGLFSANRVSLGSCSGGSLYFDDMTQVVIEDSAFVASEARSQTGSGWGGAVFGQASAQVRIADSSFEDNDSPYGSAVFLINTSEFELTDSSFVNNRADITNHDPHNFTDGERAMAGTITGCSFAGPGGGLELNTRSGDEASAMQARVVDCTFNDTSGGRGGAVTLRGDGLDLDTVVFEDSTFNNNYAAFEGGAVWLTLNARASFVRCDFTDNLVDGGDLGHIPPGAGVGGAVALSTSSNIMAGTTTAALFEDCLFTDNEALEAGGAIYATNGATVTVLATTLEATLDPPAFARNSAKRGGAVALSAAGPGEEVYGSVGSFSRVAFVDNTAANLGGALATTGGEASLEQCVFSGNQADGEPDDIHESPAGSVSCEGCIFGP